MEGTRDWQRRVALDKVKNWDMSRSSGRLESSTDNEETLPLPPGGANRTVDKRGVVKKGRSNQMSAKGSERNSKDKSTSPSSTETNSGAGRKDSKEVVSNKRTDGQAKKRSESPPSWVSSKSSKYPSSSNSEISDDWGEHVPNSYHETPMTKEEKENSVTLNCYLLKIGSYLAAGIGTCQPGNISITVSKELLRIRIDAPTFIETRNGNKIRGKNDYFEIPTYSVMSIFIHPEDGNNKNSFFVKLRPDECYRIREHFSMLSHQFSSRSDGIMEKFLKFGTTRHKTIYPDLDVLHSIFVSKMMIIDYKTSEFLFCRAPPSKFSKPRPFLEWKDEEFQRGLDRMLKRIRSPTPQRSPTPEDYENEPPRKIRKESSIKTRYPDDMFSFKCVSIHFGSWVCKGDCNFTMDPMCSELNINIFMQKERQLVKLRFNHNRIRQYNIAHYKGKDKRTRLLVFFSMKAGHFVDYLGKKFRVRDFSRYYDPESEDIGKSQITLVVKTLDEDDLLRSSAIIGAAVNNTAIVTGQPKVTQLVKALIRNLTAAG